MNRLWVLLIIFVIGCGSEEPTDEIGDDFRDDRGARIDAAQESSDNKGDEPRPCGDHECLASLCGYDCTLADSQCERACADDASRENTFVKLTITGAETETLDTTIHEYDPVFSLTNVLMYGCNLWDFSNQSRDTLDIDFEEIFEGSFVVSDEVDNTGRRARVSVPTYLGPASYTGEGFYVRSEEARRESDFYYDKEGCGFEISATETGGLSGTVTCDVPHKTNGSSIKMEGEFSCGIDSMRTLIIRMSDQSS